MDQGGAGGRSYSGLDPEAREEFTVPRTTVRTARRRRAAAPATAPTPAADETDERLQRVVERPDGWHWIDVLGRQEFGPFDSLEAALADMESPADEALLEDRIEAAEQGLELPGPIEPQGLDEPESAT